VITGPGRPKTYPRALGVTPARFNSCDDKPTAGTRTIKLCLTDTTLF